jgi:glycosyltransferase involved in cell wall biosynthesis
MAKPRIALDGYNLTLEQGTGIATYARNLSYRLGGLGAEVGVLYGQRAGASSRDELLREVTLLDAKPRSTHPILRAIDDFRRGVKISMGVTATSVPITDRIIRRGIDARIPYANMAWNVPELFRAGILGFGRAGRFGKVTLPDGPEVMHWTYPLPLRVTGARNIYTIHDLVPLRMPYATLDVKRRFLGTLREIVSSGDHIVTVSEASKRDIVNLLEVPEERVTCTWQAVSIPDAMAKKPEALARAEVKGVFGLDWQQYWLFFGGIEPKKNVARLIEGYLASGSPHPLVICGRQAWQAKQELALLYEDDLRVMNDPGPPDGIQSLARKLRERVIMLEYAPFRLLVSLIRGARAVTFPSLYEGFGLPVLEAMLLGTPVLTANVASLPEVAGDAAILVDPYDTRAIAEAIQALDRDDGLRADLAQRGPKQAALFSEEVYSKRLRAMYGRLGVVFPE